MCRAVVLSALLAACGGTPAPAPRASPPPAAPAAPASTGVDPAPASEPDPTGIDWETVPYATDEDALAIWARLGLDGASFAERLAWVPEQPAALREAMAKALLRQGNFACPPIKKPLSCEKQLLEFPELGAELGLGDPCLRRELALWALGELDDEVLAGELAADMIALAGLPPPEEELNRAALYRVEDTTLRLQMLDAAERAGNEVIADENLGNLSVSGLEAAVLQHHIDGALVVLGVDGSLNLYLQALVDPALRPETRAHAAIDLGIYGAQLDPSDPNLTSITAALERARLAADCDLAGAALDALEEIDHEPRRSVLTKKSKPDAYTRALCLALHRSEGRPEVLGEVLDQITPKGVVVEERFQDAGRVAQLWLEYPDEPDANRDGAPDVPEADPDGDGDPTTWVEAQRVAREDLGGLGPLWNELGRALQTCTTAECRLPGQDVWFRLHWKKASGRLQLARIERRETVGACAK